MMPGDDPPLFLIHRPAGAIVAHRGGHPAGEVPFHCERLAYRDFGRLITMEK
jgi:hypothetical protein